MAGLEWRRRQVFHFQNRKVFFYHRAFNDRRVLSQSLTILCSVAGIGHSPRGRGGILPYKRLMVMRRWIRAHFHVWIDYNGVAFSMELLDGVAHSRIFGVKKVLHIYG